MVVVVVGVVGLGAGVGVVSLISYILNNRGVSDGLGERIVGSGSSGGVGGGGGVVDFIDYKQPRCVSYELEGGVIVTTV